MRLPRPGEKERTLQGTQAQSKRLAAALTELLQYVSLPVKRALRNVSVGVSGQCPSCGEWVVTILVHRGKSLQHAGVGTKHGLLLHSEEAVFAVERGDVCILRSAPPSLTDLSKMYHDIPLSIAESYDMMLKKGGRTQADFVVYGYLRRLGFIIRRCAKDLSGNCGRHHGVDAADVCPTFLCWQPSKLFRKSCPGRPAFAVVVTEATGGDSAANVSAIFRELVACETNHVIGLLGNVSLRIAVVDGGQIVFYDAAQSGELPALPPHRTDSLRSAQRSPLA